MQFLFPEDAKSTYVAHPLGTFQMSSLTCALKNGNSQAVRIPADLADEHKDSELEIERIGDEFRIRPTPRFARRCVIQVRPALPGFRGPKTVATMSKRKGTASGARRSDRELAGTWGALTRNKSQTSQPDSNRPTSTEGGVVQHALLIQATERNS